MPKTSMKTKPSIDLMVDILDLQRTIYRKAEDRGLARYLVDYGTLSVTPKEHDGGWWASIELRFQPNLGMEFKLTTLVTGRDGKWPIDQAALSDLFVEYLEHLRAKATAAAANRRAIREAALQVIAEATREGIALELVRMEASPVDVFGSPDPLDQPQAFYVHLLMPYDDAGTLTEDVFVIDADKAEEFASYLRTSELPKIRELLARQPLPVAA